MFKKILIANRGEIAVRIIRACRELGIWTVAVYSEADKDALHTQLADEAVCIGPAAAKDSYLNIPNIISATVLSGAQAIHPGYGLLSENAKFARMCAECNITFIGPPAHAIERMGDKLSARLTMIEAGVPVVPGSVGLVDAQTAAQDAKAAGYPVMIKAASGGGGRGIRQVKNESELESAMELAQKEAEACFADGTVYIEKLITNARHIEFQLLCDTMGNAVHLFERDCSMQRRRQKLIEESPSVALSDAARKKMGEAAVNAARAVGYVGAGTVEFLVDASGKYYFMEMNTRIQVEHPITEEITGVDLVKEQILVAAGLPLSFCQSDLAINGHSIECRICAEDPSKDFMPSCGKVTVMHLPGGPGVRWDSMLYNGCVIPPFYDSMIGKLVVHAKDRTAAIVRMKRALGELELEGVATNSEFLFDVISTPEFESGRFNTATLEQLSGKRKAKG